MVFTSLREASKYAAVSQQTILIWTDKYAIGELTNGRWHIHKEKLDAVLEARLRISRIRSELRSVG